LLEAGAHAGYILLSTGGIACGEPAVHLDALSKETHVTCIRHSSLLVFLVFLVASSPSIGWADSAEAIRTATGVRNGLIVHLGSGDGKLTAALGAAEGTLVHALDADSRNVAAAREHVKSKGIYGKVTIDRLSGDRLPYVDDLANLVISENPGGVSPEEIMRVLCPGGVAYLKRDGRWQKRVKPWPAEIDEWTHFLHGPDNNAVAHDSVVDLPQRLKWLGKPKFARAHEQLASLSGCVTTGGRLFYIVDDTPRADVRFPSRWSLVARDAFNGVVLWTREIPAWVDQLRRFRSGPAETSFRLVAEDGRVYVTLGHDAPVSILDAATGRTLATCEATDNARQILRLGDLLLVLIDTGPQTTKEEDSQIRRGLKPAPGERAIVAADATTGKLLWRESIEPFVHPSLAAADGRLFYQTNRQVVCLDIGSGKQLWRAEMALSLSGHELGWESPTTVAHGPAVYCADFKQIVAYAAKDGKVLWSGNARPGYNAPPDVFVIDGLVWTGAKAMSGADPITGEVKRQVPAVGGYMHARCYRNKATDRFLLRGDQGVQYVSLASGDTWINHWIRGTCQYGIMPANGLLYITPDSCACNMKTKLAGLWALAPAAAKTDKPAARGKRLQRGPAFARSLVAVGSEGARDDSSWPVYRHDFARSGMTPANVPATLKTAWRADIGGRLSGVTANGGRVFVASIDRHTVYALDEWSGEIQWSFTAGGRVDSPPTIYRGAALFGSADGWVYALRADDGTLDWRFRAAPEESLTFVNGQLESVWPVHGSVLIDRDLLVVAAGRSSYLDGGIRLYRLDPATGRVMDETTMYTPDPETQQQPAGGDRKDVRGALSDILVADGGDVYMRHVKLDPIAGDETGTGMHLFSPVGLLDDTWWHRGYWVLNDHFVSHWSGWWKVGNQVPSGRILSYDAKRVFGYGRDKYPSGNTGQWRGGEKYRLFAQDRPTAAAAGQERWSVQVPFYVRAMVVAGETMFIAGPPELTQTKGVGESALELEHPEDALAAWQGKKGGRLWAVSTADGRRLAEYELTHPPVFDGMAATEGRVYLAAQDGALICFGE